MVLMAGEFGRTPRIRNFNGVPGRDHWGPAGNALVYGGDMRMGQVIGATNRHGERPVERPVKPNHYRAATGWRVRIKDSRLEFVLARVESRFNKRLGQTE